MKRHILSKTTPFHVKKKKEQNGVVLSDTVLPSSSPGRAVGKKETFVFFFFNSSCPSPSPRAQPNPKPHAPS
jgi:hypothetical protein